MPTLTELGVVTVTVDGFTLHYRVPGGPAPADADGVEWVVEEITGWGGPGTRTAREARSSGRHGSYRGRPARTERVIGMRFAVSVPYGHPEMVPGVQRQVAAMCADPEALHTLTVNDPWQGALSADVELDDEVLSEWRSPWTNAYSVQFAAPDPRLHGPWVVYETPPPTYTGGLDAGLGLDAGTGLSAGTVDRPGTVTVRNTGTAESSPVFELVGQATSPRVIAQETGQEMGLALEIPTAQSLWINTGEFPALGLPARSVLLDGNSSRRRYLSIPRGWPVIGAGEVATFALRADSWDANATLRVHTRTAWW